MKAIEKFHQGRSGLRFYENPITLHVWEYQRNTGISSIPITYEYVIHYGDHGESSPIQFPTKEEACEAAWTQAIVYLEDTLEEFKGDVNVERS